MSANSLLHKTQDFIDFESITAKTFKRICFRVNIRETINEVINTVKILKQAKLVKISMSCEQSVPLFMYGDKKRIQQILSNLLDNAWRASHLIGG